MKLLLCGHCKDIKAVQLEMTWCQCRKTRAMYRQDGWHADIWGDDCMMLGIANDDRYALLAGHAVFVSPQDENHPRVTYHKETLPATWYEVNEPPVSRLAGVRGSVQGLSATREIGL